MWIKIILLCLFLFAGTIGAASDIRQNIVSNRMIAICGIAALLLEGLNLLLFPAEYLLIWVVNLLIAAALAIVFYIGGIWAAGDVKLFLLLYVSIPYQWIETDTLSMSVIPFLFIFLLAGIWLAADSLWQTLHHAERFDMQEQLTWKRLLDVLKIYIQMSALHMLCSWLFPSFCERNALFLAVLTLLYSYACSSNRTLGSWPSIVLHGAFLFAGILMGKWHFSFSNNWIYFAAAAVLLFRHWAAGYNYRRIPTDAVCSGMILSTAPVLSFAASRIQGLPDNASESMAARLTAKQAEAVRKWGRSAKGSKNIVIVRKIPFAIFIFGGMLAWITVRLLGAWS